MMMARGEIGRWESKTMPVQARGAVAPCT
jgi:hypothetical protein